MRCSKNVMNYSKEVTRMLDKIVLGFELSLPLRNPRVQFDSPTWLGPTYPGKIMAKLNVSANEKRLGIYRPSFTYYQNPIGLNKPRYLLYAQFSVPKLIYGNNFQEVREQELSRVIQAVKDALGRIGINMSTEQILKTRVIKVDFAKNVIYTNYTSTNLIIKNIATADISTRYDVLRADFKNGGQAYHVHTGIEDIVIYDKVDDLRQSRKGDARAVERDNYTQRDLLELFSQHKNISVVRFEVRLRTKRKIQLVLSKVGVDSSNLTFEALFSTNIARRVLSYEWESILDAIPKMTLSDETPERVLDSILADRSIKPRQALDKIAMRYLLSAQDTRYIRNRFDKRFGQHAWARLSGLRDPPNREDRQLKDLLQISNQIREMKPVDINNLTP